MELNQTPPPSNPTGQPPDSPPLNLSPETTTSGEANAEIGFVFQSRANSSSPPPKSPSHSNKSSAMVSPPSMELDAAVLTPPSSNSALPSSTPPVAGSTQIPDNFVTTGNRDFTIVSPPLEEIPPTSFVPSLGAWNKRINIIPEPEDLSSRTLKAPLVQRDSQDKGFPPPALKENGQFRFPWAAKMNPQLRNLHRATSPSYLEDGTPMIDIPDHVLLKGLENQNEYVIGQFFRCKTPSGGLVHAVANRIWGKKGKIFTRKLSESSYLFHIPDASTRAWVLQRGLWHVDECLLFVAPWTPEATLAMPEISSVPVWVTLTNIPSRLYSHCGISYIASGLGEPVLTEKPRLDPSLMGRAKILVEIELEKGFPTLIGVRDRKGIVSLVDVEYTWIPSKCVICGKLGHKESRCLLQHPVVDPNLQDEATKVIVAPSVTDVPTTLVAPATPTFLAKATGTSPKTTIEPAAITPTHVSPCVQAEPTISSPSINLVQDGTTFSPTTPPDLVTVSTLPKSDSLDYEDVQGNVFGGNSFATLDTRDFSGYEIGDFSLQSRGGRPIKLTLKVQEMKWTLVGKRGKKGQRGGGGHGPPS